MLKQFQKPKRVRIKAPTWLRNLRVCLLLGAAIVAVRPDDGVNCPSDILLT